MSSHDGAVAIAAEAALVEQLTEEIMRSADPDPACARDHVTAASALTTPRVVETLKSKFIDAVNLPLQHELDANARTPVYGQDVALPGRVFGATRNLQRNSGTERVFDTPISENAILGSAVGAALVGWRPIVEIMWTDFLFVALDQIVNQAANIRYVTGGRWSALLVIRTKPGATPGSCPTFAISRGDPGVDKTWGCSSFLWPVLR